LQTQVRDLREVVSELKAEAAAYRAESADLRRELQTTRSEMAASGILPAPAVGAEETAAPKAAAASAEPQQAPQRRVAALEDSIQLLSDKVDEQYQTKIESASKYRMRLSGIVLLNLFGNQGMTDNQDFPSYALPPNPYDSGHNFGASLRQSEIGLEVFGPRLAGAKTMGTLQADFAGGFPNTLNGVNSGLFRLRLANVRMDWDRTSIVAGQDNLFLSPLAPTSFASLAVPALSYEGNLWAWTPQIRIEHRFDVSEGQTITVQGGILDNLSGEPPYTTYGRLPQAGERSGQPAYAGRVAWKGQLLGEPVSLGTGAYYGRQDWGFNRNIDGWASTADVEIGLTRWTTLSGEFYRGSAIGGLGGGTGRSVVYSGSPFDPATQVRALNAAGGWAQLKIKPYSRLEFNGAFGLDSPFSSDLRVFPSGQSYLDPTLAVNRAMLLNFIYRPRSDLLFSTEYRHLKTFHVNNDNYSADQVNLVMGVLF
jgi:hypothetical protein